ncbi:MAG: hypothetical protein OEY49_04205 [Candidatus Heimdallarchaeota archaeon]|nr:hypothetical protein [Candidatus Heimdallarchaeota archaeon]
MNTLDSNHQYFSKLSYFIFIGYLALSFVTYFLIVYFDWANDLFDQTELIIKINAVWFSLGIVSYGIFALRRNLKRAKLSDLELKLDTQFLIVVAFLFFGIKQIIDLLLLMFKNLEEQEVFALNNTGKVLEFGGFMAGLLSIYLGRRKNS